MSLTLEATIRSKHGKGASRRARMAGQVPAVVYGPGKPTLSVALNPKELVKALTGPLKRNALITIKVKDDAGKVETRTAMLKDLQFHPIRRTATHADFVETSPDAVVPVKIPIEVTGKSKAIADGAKMTLITRTVTLNAKANAVPEKVTYDVTDEGFGVIRAKQIKLPAGTSLFDPPETPLISLKIPRGDKEEEAAAAAAALVPAEGAAAAPGAPGAPGAAAAPAAGAKGAPAAGAAPAEGDKKGDKKK